MLTRDQLTTLRAALQFWQEEMCPHGIGAMRTYLDGPMEVPLSATEVADLQSQLSDSAVRYVICQPGQGQLGSTELFGTLEAAADQATSPELVATLLLPLARP